MTTDYKKMALFLSSVFVVGCASMEPHFVFIEDEVETVLAELQEEITSQEESYSFDRFDNENLSWEEGSLFISKNEVEKLAQKDEEQIFSKELFPEDLLKSFSVADSSEYELGLKEEAEKISSSNDFDASSGFTSPSQEEKLSVSKQEEDASISKKEESASVLKQAVKEPEKPLLTPKPSHLEEKPSRKLATKENLPSVQVLNQLEEEDGKEPTPVSFLKSLRKIRVGGQLKIVLKSNQRVNYKTYFEPSAGEVIIDLEKVILSDSFKKSLTDKNIKFYEVPSRQWARLVFVNSQEE